MQRLEVSGAVRPIYGLLGVKRLIYRLPTSHILRKVHSFLVTVFSSLPLSVTSLRNTKVQFPVALKKILKHTLLLLCSWTFYFCKNDFQCCIWTLYIICVVIISYILYVYDLFHIQNTVPCSLSCFHLPNSSFVLSFLFPFCYASCIFISFFTFFCIIFPPFLLVYIF